MKGRIKLYFVDRKKMEETLVYVEKSLTVFKHQGTWENEIETLALERVIHVVIEAMIDVGNQMIDGFIMRDPGSYVDIIDILCDEKVVTEDESDGLKAVIKQRKVLVHDYISVDHQQLQQVFQKNFSIVEKFPAAVRMYLQKELGPVSAFSPEE